MSKALAWIRKSKGRDDDIGLEDQREEVGGVARQLVEEVETLDLGVHTGFSSMTRENDAETLLDENELVQDAVERLGEGEFEFLVAYDDSRLCRDDYFSIIKYACTQGDCEIVYVADVDEDDLTFDLKRRIERETKEEEIAKSKRALEKKQELGHDLGPPKLGMEYNTEKTRQVPGEDFEKVERIFELRGAGESYTAIAETVGVSVGAAHKVVERREWYAERSDSESIRLAASR